MPKHLQVEAGFTEEISSLGEDISGSDNSSKRVAALEDEFSEYKKQRRKIDGAMERVASYLDAKGVRKEDTMDSYIKKVADYSQKMQDDAILDSMSPSSKGMYVETLKKQRKNLLLKMANASKISNESKANNNADANSNGNSNRDSTTDNRVSNKITMSCRYDHRSCTSCHVAWVSLAHVWPA